MGSRMGIRDKAPGVKGGIILTSSKVGHSGTEFQHSGGRKAVNRSTWATQSVPAQPELPGKTLSQRQKKANKQKKVRPGRRQEVCLLRTFPLITGTSRT